MATKELKKNNKRMNLTPWMTNAGTRKAHPDEGGPGVEKKSESLAEDFRESIPGAALAPFLGLQQEL